MKKSGNLSRIVCGIDAEIMNALALISQEESKFSKVYWPRAFRLLVVNILQFLLQKPEVWSDLSTPFLTTNQQFLEILITELSFSTSTYMKVKQREWVYRLLRQMSWRNKEGLNFHDPAQTMTDWPYDIEDESDLLSRLASGSLRSDVKKYLWRIIDEVIPADKYCNMHYFGLIKSLKKILPIRIDVPEDFVEAIKDRITSISHQILSQCENMLPIHLVEIQGVPDRGVVITKEEGFSTSGSPWKVGTL